jgi:hypothetical protein
VPARIIITTPTTAMPTAIERQSSHGMDNRCDNLGRWMTGGSWYTAGSICSCAAAPYPALAFNRAGPSRGRVAARPSPATGRRRPR